MTNTQLDPELELEAQQLANYEDERRELIEREEMINEDFEATKEARLAASKFIDNLVAEELEKDKGFNQEKEKTNKFSIDDFRINPTIKKVNEDSDYGTNVLAQFRYGVFFSPLQIEITNFSDKTWSLFIHRYNETGNVKIEIVKHNFDDYQDALDYLNNHVDFINKIADEIYN